jgi:tRNA pseudouridine38-40 synthase
MPNLKITLAYDGFDFHGWQVQPDRPTIQGTLSDALRRITGESVLPQGSGRTDAGVHALAQVASCSIASTIPTANLVIALNDILPPTIRVLRVEPAPADFHARKSARAKTYQYRIYRADICPPLLARYVYHHPYPLDEGAIIAAAAEVAGEHDFTSFAAVDPEKSGKGTAGKGTAGKGTASAVPLASEETGALAPEGDEDERSAVRTIFTSQWQRSSEELVYTVRGSGFLHHMVRNLVGTFLLLGKGTLKPKDVSRILQARNRSANPGATAPAHGLYLISVEY